MRLKVLLNRPFDRVNITTLGKFFSVFTLFFGIATINSGNNLLYMILAYLLVLLFASGILSTMNILFLKVAPETQDIIYKRKEGYILIKVSKSRIPGFSLYFCTKDGCTFVPEIKNNEITIKLPYVGKKRGIQKIDNITVYSLYPFGFAKRGREMRLNMDVLVLPDINRKVDKNGYYQKFALGDNSVEKKGVDGEFLGLARYRSGESLYHIHWKKSYKELQVKKFSTMEKDSVVFHLKEHPDDDEIDIVASLIHREIEKGKSVGLLVDNRFYVAPSTGSVHALGILRKLALL